MLAEHISPSLLRALLLLALPVPWASAVAQNVVNDSTASVIAYWEPGDRRSYMVERERTGMRHGRSTYTLVLRVLDATDSTYLLESRVSDLRVETDLPEDLHERAVFQRILGASEGLRVLCTTDETGIPIALANPTEVEEHARQALQQVLDLARSAAEGEEMQHTLAPVLAAAVLVQASLEDIGNLLFPFGVAYITGRREEVRSEVPNPLGGIPLGTSQVFTMTHLYSKARTARMRMEQQVDPRAVDDALNELLDSSGGQGLEGEAREELRRTLEGIRVSDTMDIEVDLDGAWSRRVHMVRVTEVQGRRGTETWTYISK